jgi:hypothetical protein
MTPQKYSARIITQKSNHKESGLPGTACVWGANPSGATSGLESILSLNDQIAPGAVMSLECAWIKSGAGLNRLLEEPRVHDYDEVIGFVSSNPDNPGELGARLQFRLEDEVHDLSHSSLIYLPTGLRHGGLIVSEITHPIFAFVLAPIPNFIGSHNHAGFGSGQDSPTPFPPPSLASAGSKYGGYVITKPKSHAPPGRPAPPPNPNVRAKQVVSLDSAVIPGAPYVDFVWIWSGSMTMSPEPHTHDFEEIIAVIDGKIGEKGRPIGGQVSLGIEGEKQAIPQSSLVYLPKLLPHCPLEFKNITEPVLCFTIGNSLMWATRENR